MARKRTVKSSSNSTIEEVIPRFITAKPRPVSVTVPSKPIAATCLFFYDDFAVEFQLRKMHIKKNGPERKLYETSHVVNERKLCYNARNFIKL